jgi:hypothetical protein
VGVPSSEWLDRARAKPAAGRHRIFIERASAVLRWFRGPLLLGFATLGDRIMETRHLRGIRRRSVAAFGTPVRGFAAGCD